MRIIARIAKWLRHRLLKPTCAGSNPAAGAIKDANGSLDHRGRHWMGIICGCNCKACKSATAWVGQDHTNTLLRPGDITLGIDLEYRFKIRAEDLPRTIKVPGGYWRHIGGDVWKFYA